MPCGITAAARLAPLRPARPLPRSHSHHTQRSGTSSRVGGGVGGCRARRCYHHCNPVWLCLSVSPLGCRGRGTLPLGGRDPLLGSRLSDAPEPPLPPTPFSRSDLQNSPKWARLLLSVCPLKSSEVKQIDQSDISMHTKTLFWYVAPFVLRRAFHIAQFVLCVTLHLL